MDSADDVPGDLWSAVSPPLSEAVLNTIRGLKFKKMTPVQTSTIPLFLKHKDVAVEAVTGSGKTLAFVIPICEILMKKQSRLKKHDVGAVVLSPTRELAVQIHQVFNQFVFGSDLSLALVVGGKNRVTDDLSSFAENGGHIIVGTPGRLEDMVTANLVGYEDATAKLKAGLKALEVLVLDEGDRLLGLGFDKSLNAIMAVLPKQRRTGLFSATQVKSLDKLSRAGLRNPVLVSVKAKEDKAGGGATAEPDQSTPATLDNYFLVSNQPEEKFANLVAFMREKKVGVEDKAIVFFATCACVEYFSLLLNRLFKKETTILTIHSKKAKRNKIFEEFRKAESGVLICTDVMARGIDVPDVKWVLQFDPPSSAEAFVHRCGRTARIGNTGTAVLFLLPSEDAYVEFLALNQKVILKPMSSPETPEPGLLTKLRGWQKKDRTVFDMANRAYVSFIQAYSKHECKFVLRLRDLPFGKLATAFGLLRMPKMPELKNKKIAAGEFKPDAVDTNDIKYKDKQKEKSRQQKLEVYRETNAWPGFKGAKGGGFQGAWSHKLQRKEKKAARRLKREKQLKAARRKADAAAATSTNDDEDELERDYKLLKKMKKGKCSDADFDMTIELDAVDSEPEEKEQH